VEGSIFLCFSILCAGTYAVREEDTSVWSLKVFERYGRMATMFQRSRVSGISACIPGQEGTADSTPIEGQEDEDHSEEHREEQITPSSSTGKNLKRK
jgi:hypothetical protein